MNANWFALSKRAVVWGLIVSGAGVGGAFSPLLLKTDSAMAGKTDKTD